MKSDLGHSHYYGKAKFHYDCFDEEGRFFNRFRQPGMVVYVRIDFEPRERKTHLG